ncbi:MAG: restriction endonuclease subunit S [Thermosynechococcaceae cyanobacterium]
MTDETTLLLERHFDTAFAAPDGIKKLRKLILTLAMRGELVLQNPADETAEHLLKQNQKLIVKAMEGKRKALPKLNEKKVKIPLGWVRCHLADVALVVMGNSPPGNTYNDNGDGVPLINGPVEFSRDAFGPTLKTKYTTAPSRLCTKNDLLVCVRGATTGRTNIAAFDACIGRGVALVRGWTAQQYLNYLLWHLGQQLLEQGKGTTFPSISYADLAGLEILLPPFAEQRRIVTKIDQLMARCDELEKLRDDRNQKRLTVHTAALNRLLNAPEGQPFDDAWTFITQNFSELYSVKENVAELRKAILQLAVMGKLVPQDPNDPPASELLDAIALEKQRLVKEKKSKKQKPVQKQVSSEIGSQIPEGWIHTCLDELFLVSGGIQKTPKRTPVMNHHPYIGVANVQRGRLELHEVKRFELIEGELEKWALQTGDIMVVEGNGSAEEVGRCAIWKGEIEKCVHQNHLIKCRPLHQKISDYILMLLNSPIGMHEMKRLAVTTSGLYNLSVSKIRGINLLLPPLPEQQRIVTKVNRLMSLCDVLEEKIDGSSKQKQTLLNTVMAQV